jgi:hypothetical protein
MSPSRSSGIPMRNALIALAGICMLISFVAIAEPADWLEPRVFVAAVVAAGAGLLAALGTREFASLLFELGDPPWYAQRGGMLFALFMVTVAGVLYAWTSPFLLGVVIWEISPLLFISLASQLACIAWLDGPRAAASPRERASNRPGPSPANLRGMNRVFDVELPLNPKPLGDQHDSTEQPPRPRVPGG